MPNDPLAEIASALQSTKQARPSAKNTSASVAILSTRFRIIGAYRETGEDVAVSIEVPDRAAAEDWARRHAIVWSEIRTEPLTASNSPSNVTLGSSPSAVAINRALIVAFISLAGLTLSPFLVWVRVLAGGVLGFNGDGKLVFWGCLTAGAMLCLYGFIRRSWLIIGCGPASAWASVCLAITVFTLRGATSNAVDATYDGGPLAALLSSQMGPGNGLLLAIVFSALCVVSFGYVAIHSRDRLGRVRAVAPWLFSQGFAAACFCVVILFGDKLDSVRRQLYGAQADGAKQSAIPNVAPSRSSSVASIASAKKTWVAPKLSIAPHQRTVSGLDFNTLVWQITNEGENPIVIQHVVYNGEHEAVPGFLLGEYLPSDDERLPKTLTIGDSVLMFQFNGWLSNRPINYGKQVLYMDIYTDQGNYRYRPGEGFSPLPSGVALPPAPPPVSPKNPDDDLLNGPK